MDVLKPDVNRGAAPPVVGAIIIPVVDDIVKIFALGSRKGRSVLRSVSPEDVIAKDVNVEDIVVKDVEVDDVKVELLEVVEVTDVVVLV